MEQVMYQESHLQIQNWFPETESFLVSCVRCGNAVEVTSQMILEPLQCPKCDGRIEEQVAKQPKNTQMKVALVPATISLPGGVQLFVYLPMLLEGPHELNSH